MEKKGKLFNKYTVDRIENHKGYEPGNLQLLTLSANSAKYQNVDKYIYKGERNLIDPEQMFINLR